jgi:AraC-like DNA-binding protein
MSAVIPAYSPYGRGCSAIAPDCARDARFDGLFFTAVKFYAHVFCRPICPAEFRFAAMSNTIPTPRPRLRRDYRPCLRCRPEVSPDLPVWAGTSATVNRALRLIEDGALDQGSTQNLADRLGLTDRHLRRLISRTRRRSPRRRCANAPHAVCEKPHHGYESAVFRNRLRLGIFQLAAISMRRVRHAIGAIRKNCGE